MLGQQRMFPLSKNVEIEKPKKKTRQANISSLKFMKKYAISQSTNVLVQPG